ncbi:glycerophosphodiester phosphodiesterase [Streptomyces sp. W4I9-2]|uniref:glycerophosphodiester phosphodiesterase n=1 Tax=Streptomyces sp. W4I9-2 TaxID=3042297 RepID=UPI0027887FBF|nr:glycerophosphodiester phosphodiesterase [Streptomyces sp. W4I9-2]MDQ0694219.1 glycerophosphoryl diester phosphodiesterase [Streptomyces sp. W4I9-2]
MALPDDLPTVTLTGTYTHPDGSPMKGSVSVTPLPRKVVSADTGLTVQGRAKETISETDGTVTLTVLATDAPGINPTGFTYRVDIAFHDAIGDSFIVELPSAAPDVKLPAITPASPSEGDYVVVTGPEGPAGPTGPAGADGAPGEPGPPGADGSNADAEQYTDNALTAEITRADAAYDPAGSAAAARTAAISAAAGDATTKANNAQAAAISAASADASAKAGNAQTAAVTTAASSAAALYLPNAIQTVDAYFAGATPSSPRFFAHRGGGMVRPEHTLAGYRASAAQGFPLEVSVNVDASGELWCIHDTTMDRTTNRTGNVNTFTTEEISQQTLTVSKPMLGAGWTEQPLVPLRQVLDEFLGKVVIFLEAKGNDAVVPTQTLLSTYYPHAPRSVVWKAHIGTASLPWAKDPTRNYRTWVYLDDGTADAAITAKDQYIDYLGVSTTMADARVAQIVARGKPVFSWPVYRRSQVARLTGLGVVGIMASDPRYVSTALPQRTASRWDLQVKEPGGTPGLDYDATYALSFAPAPDVGWVSINALPNQSYGLGTYAPAQGSAAGYRIVFDMKYKVLPAATVHGGFYFGKVTDDGYRFSTANASGGYHVVMRASGDMQLYRHTAGSTTGTQIGSTITTTTPIADTAMSFQINVTPTTVELKRTDGAGWTTGPIADATYRGGYLGLSNGSITDLATRPYWRNLIITQL